MDLKNKKVLVVATTDDMIGRFMIPHIQEMQRLGAEVFVACRNTGDFFEETKNATSCEMFDVSFTRFPFTLKNMKGYKKLKKIVKEFKPDLINCLQPVGGVMGRLVSKKFKLPCLYTAHGFHFYKGAPLKNKLIYKTIEKWCSKHTTSLVTMNEEDYQAALKMKAKKVYKINGIGVDFSKYKVDKDFDKQGFKKELGLEEDDFVVASVGELNKNKNTLRLVDAMSKIENKKIKYLICGEGPLHQKYQDKIEKLGLTDNVKMLGFRRDIPKILNCVDLYVMPSFREGLSKSMMEAMAYGLPVVASAIRGNVDLLGKEEGGLLLSPKDTDGFANAFEKLAEDKQLCKKFGERNKTYVQDYSIEKVKAQMEKIYKEL